MTNSLIEKVTKVVMATRYGAPELIARDVAAAVLDHFSDPENVTPAMLNALDDAWLGLVDSEPRSVCIHAAIAAAMKAAKEELK